MTDALTQALEAAAAVGPVWSLAGVAFVTTDKVSSLWRSREGRRS